MSKICPQPKGPVSPKVMEPFKEQPIPTVKVKVLRLLSSTEPETPLQGSSAPEFPLGLAELSAVITSPFNLSLCPILPPSPPYRYSPEHFLLNFLHANLGLAVCFIETHLRKVRNKIRFVREQ